MLWLFVLLAVVMAPLAVKLCKRVEQWGTRDACQNGPYHGTAALERVRCVSDALFVLMVFLGPSAGMWLYMWLAGQYHPKFLLLVGVFVGIFALHFIGYLVHALILHHRVVTKRRQHE